MVLKSVARPCVGKMLYLTCQFNSAAAPATLDQLVHRYGMAWMDARWMVPVVHLRPSVLGYSDDSSLTEYYNWDFAADRLTQHQITRLLVGLLVCC